MPIDVSGDGYCYYHKNQKPLAIQAPEQPIQAPEQPIQAPEQPIQAPEQPIQAPEQPIQAPEQPIQAPPTSNHSILRDSFQHVSAKITHWLPRHKALTIAGVSTVVVSAIMRLSGDLPANIIGSLLATILQALFPQLVPQHTTPLLPMPGTHFNIALVAFNGHGKGIATTGEGEARGLNEDIRIALMQLLNARDANSEEITVQSYNQDGLIRDGTEQTHDARAVAMQTNADVVIYGDVNEDVTTITFTPSFYLATSRHLGGNDELGQYSFGELAQHGAPDTDGITAKRWHMAVARQAHALAEFVLGLEHYKAHDFQNARTYFNRANSDWIAQSGREVLYLFLGNVAGQLDDFSDQTGADANYQHALKLTNRQYARAWIGDATVKLELSKGERCDLHAPNFSLRGLNDAAQTYKNAEKALYRPVGADIDIKASFGLGRVDLCLAQAEGLTSPKWDAAETDFRTVLTDYQQQVHEQGTSIYAPEQVALSYGNIGLILIHRAYSLDVHDHDYFTHQAQDYRQAIDDLTKAISWLTNDKENPYPPYQSDLAAYYSSRGYSFQQLWQMPGVYKAQQAKRSDCDAAAEDYSQARILFRSLIQGYSQVHDLRRVRQYTLPLHQVGQLDSRECATTSLIDTSRKTPSRVSRHHLAVDLAMPKM